MSVPVRDYDRYYPADLNAGYVTFNFSDAATALSSVNESARTLASPSVRDSQSSLLSAVWTISHCADVENWDGEGARAITPETSMAAMQLICALPEGLPPPEISAESTGEVSFEWYRDRSHVAVLTVQDNLIRWSAVVGMGAPRHGREFFRKSIPCSALNDIQVVIG